MSLLREGQRIDFLVARDGEVQTRAWVARTLEIYRAAVQSPASHASHQPYRTLFEESVRDFEEWLGNLPPAEK